jgi:hypothetical protein
VTILKVVVLFENSVKFFWRFWICPGVECEIGTWSRGILIVSRGTGVIPHTTEKSGFVVLSATTLVAVV